MSTPKNAAHFQANLIRLRVFDGFAREIQVEKGIGHAVDLLQAPMLGIRRVLTGPNFVITLFRFPAWVVESNRLITNP